MYKIIIIISIQLSFIFSQNVDELFSTANKYYNESKYEEAIQIYEKIIERDVFSEDLYLNLGNAYFQNLENGSARWSYEMGLKLNPRNPDLRNNNNVNKNYIENYIEVPNNSIIRLKKPDSSGHFVLKTSEGKLFDPSVGIVEKYLNHTTISHYLNFKKSA